MTKPDLMIISFSPIASDARVLKQVRAFAPTYRVTTVGYGPRPEAAHAHLRIADGTPNRPFGPYLRLRAYRMAYWLMPSVRAALRLIGSRRPDVVIANDVEAVGVALAARPRCGVHADLHEYSPYLHQEIPAWHRLQTPYLNWLCSKYVARARSFTTVSGGLAAEYEKNFGFAPAVVTNAAPYQDLAATPASSPLRLVHSGVGMRDRHLDVMVQAVLDATSDVTLDLYLVPNEPAYVQDLRKRTQASARVTVHDPVAYKDLAATLHQYDVGVHLLPPVNFNNAWALPNKLFDYVQSRLAVLIGPSPEMARYVNDYGLGVIADGFTARDLATAIDALTPEAVTAYKRAAGRAARELSSANQEQIWVSAVNGLVDQVPSGRTAETERP
ncbi:glycosyltransferase [Rarobacter incanus]|uniref:Glycosyl transferase family 4 n=1 Tax=Rarobacter incanus TaxID=153494 RepID=A0A542SNP1_9MICO|nr:glycosyltransferase [Rarobacter incanus]TQK76240.1 glycosyl transferase family 4 [Rarobacter incanus]